MSEINLSQYDEQSVARRYEIDATLHDIHGEHARRTQVISSLRFHETREATEGVSEEEQTKQETRSGKSANVEEIHTFPKDEKGNLLVPLGGLHGYFMGALRTASLDLYKDKLTNRKWRGFGIKNYLEHGIHVKPEMIVVGDKVSNELDSPRLHQVFGRTYIRQYYDVVNKASIHFTIEIMNEKIPEDIFCEMLAYVQKLGLGPKRRGRLEISKVLRTK